MKREDKEEIINRALVLLNKAIKSGVSNYKIAQDTKITDRTIGNYVNGNTKPTLANAYILIDYFNPSGESKKIIALRLQHTKDIEELVKSKDSIIESLEKQINEIKEYNKILIEEKENKIDSLNRDIGRLETLLSQNNIDYPKKAGNF
jgi:plasmid maintenance system antidote protein VapI